MKNGGGKYHEKETVGGKAVLEFLDSGVAMLRLGDPTEKVTTLTVERMASLRAALATIREKKPKGLIIIGPGPDMFTAGADINAIRDVTDPKKGEELAREGQSLFDEIAKLACPTVAAISGPCVGGGCELVLACTHRLISDQKSSVIGLPEVKLGILPGFGGTQRMPRLIGLPKALDIILTGKTLRPKQALRVGLVDEIVATHKIRERAESVALNPGKVKRHRLSLVDRLLTSFPFGRRFVGSRARAQVLKETKGFYPAPPAALDAVLYGLDHGIERGLIEEAKQLGRLIVTPESKALVKIFFLTESAKGIGRSAKKSVEQVHAVVIGAGSMGAGIAGTMARNECNVILRDTTDEALQRGMAHIRKSLEKLKYLSETERSFIINRIEATSRESSNIGNSQFVIEAIFEEMEIKKKVLSDVAKLMPPDAIVATNTSSLSVNEIASAIQNPERVVGMHFFNPVEKMPLVEIIRAKSTSDKTIAVTAALATKLGKFPIVVSDVPGFLVNRILSPYLNEAAYLLQEGYRIKDIDKAATLFGMPMGPLRLLDEVGLDVAAHVSETMIKGYGSRMSTPPFAKMLVGTGRKGKKSGSGFYDFADKESTPTPKIRELLQIAQPEIQTPDMQTIADRLVLQLINEAVRCLDEGVAGAPGPEAASQIDLGTVMGIGFPPFRGGILNYADSLGAEKILSQLKEYEEKAGARFAAAPGIEQRKKSKKKFSDRL